MNDDILGYQFPDHRVTEANEPDFDIPIVEYKSTNEITAPGGKLFRDVAKYQDTCVDFLRGVSIETLASGNLGSVVQEWLTVNGIKQSKAIRLAAGELTKAVKEMK